MSKPSFFETLRTLQKTQCIDNEKSYDIVKIIKESSVYYHEDPLLSYTTEKPLPHDYTVIGIDGSRYLPDHHAGFLYALQLIAITIITYGSNKNYHYNLYPSIFEVSNEYNAEEETRDQQLKEEYIHACNELKNSKQTTVVILDGSIVKKETIPFYNETEILSAALTYTSSPRHFCISENKRINDVSLFSSFLKPYTRSAWFCAKKQPNIFICYFSAGKEIARIETSLSDKKSRDLIISIVKDQCQKGNGYPLILQYAHHHTGKITHLKTIYSKMLGKKLSIKYKSKVI